MNNVDVIQLLEGEITLLSEGESKRRKKMDEQTTVLELRKEKEKELEELIQEIKKEEKGAKATRRHNIDTHMGIIKELDMMYSRQGALTRFLKELSNGKAVS